MSYKRWRPNSRRNRRRDGRPRRETTQGADRAFLLIAGGFVLVAMLLIAALAFSTG